MMVLWGICGEVDFLNEYIVSDKTLGCQQPPAVNYVETPVENDFSWMVFPAIFSPLQISSTLRSQKNCRFVQPPFQPQKVRKRIARVEPSAFVGTGYPPRVLRLSRHGAGPV